MNSTSFRGNSIFNMIEPFRGNSDEVPNDWLDRFRDATDLHNLEDNERLVCARLLMKGNAANWYSAHKQQIKTYADFEDQFLGRFADDSLSIANALFGRFQYNNETVRVYADSILNLHDRLQRTEAPLPECVLTNHFVSGLMPDLKEKVMYRRPKNLQDAIDDAVFLEQCMNNDARFSQNPSQPPNNYQQQSKPPYQKNNNRPYNQNNNSNNRQQNALPPTGHNKEYWGQNRPLANNQPSKDPKDDIIIDLSKKLADLRIEFSQADPRLPMHQNFVQMNDGEEEPVPSKPAPKIDPNTIAELQSHYMALYNAYAPAPQPRESFACLNYLQAEHENTSNLPLLDNPAVNNCLSELKQLIESAARIIRSNEGHTAYTTEYDIYAEKRKTEANEDDWIKRRRPNNVGQDAFDPNEATRQPPRQSPPQPPPPPPQPQPPPQTQPQPQPPPQQPAPQPQAAPTGRTRAPGPAPTTAPRATGRSTILRVPTTSMDPFDQLLSLPMRFSVEGYIKHCSEASFNKTLTGLRRVREDRSAPSVNYTIAAASNGDSRFHTSLPAAQAPGAVRQALRASPPQYQCLVVPVAINGMAFDNGIIDTGASHTMISQTAIRKLDLWDDIDHTPMAAYNTASGEKAKPWGRLKQLNVAVGAPGGLEVPLENVLISESKGFDMLVGNDWLRQAKAEISYDKQQITYRIGPEHIGVFQFGPQVSVLQGCAVQDGDDLAAMQCTLQAPATTTLYLDYQPTDDDNAAALADPALPFQDNEPTPPEDSLYPNLDLLSPQKIHRTIALTYQKMAHSTFPLTTMMTFIYRI